MSEIQRWAVQEVRLFDSIFVLQVIVDRSFGFFFFFFLFFWFFFIGLFVFFFFWISFPVLFLLH